MSVVEIKVSHYMPEDHGTHVDFIAPWAAALERESGGEVRVAVHSGLSPLGKLENQYEQVASGIVDVAHSPASLPQGRFPRTWLLNLPFLASGAADGTRMLWSLFERHLRPDYDGLKVLALHADSGGVLHTRDKPIQRLDDLAGMRLRCPTGPVADVLAALGAIPVPLLPPQINQAVRDGAIDGAVMAWDVLAYTQTADVLRYHVDSKLYVSPLYFVMNDARYRALPGPARAAVDAVSGDNLVRNFGTWWSRWERPGLELARAPGHVVEHLATSELDLWRDATSPVIHAYLDRLAQEGVPDARAIYEAALDLRRTSGRDAADIEIAKGA